MDSDSQRILSSIQKMKRNEEKGKTTIKTQQKNKKNPKQKKPNPDFQKYNQNHRMIYIKQHRDKI